MLTLALAFAAPRFTLDRQSARRIPSEWRPDAMVTGDRFAQFFNFALLASAALAVLLVPALHSKIATSTQASSYALILFATAGMMLLAAALNLIVIFLAIELLSLSLYILSGFDRSRPRSQEAGFKYFLLSSFASAFLIYGMALIYGATGSTSLTRIVNCVGGNTCHGAVTTSPFLLVGISLMVVGFAFKVSVVPFHMWTPDVYEGAPTPVTAFMSVATKAAVFPAFLRVFAFSLGSCLGEVVRNHLGAAIATMIVGNVAALAQSNMKRMLAYSGIAHAGYVLVAMSATNELGTTAVAFYFVVYAFMNIGAFILVAVLESRGEVGDEISSYRGLLREARCWRWARPSSCSRWPASRPPRVSSPSTTLLQRRCRQAIPIWRHRRHHQRDLARLLSAGCGGDVYAAS